MRKTREKIQFIRPNRTPDEIGGATFAQPIVIWEPLSSHVRELKPSVDIIATQQRWNMGIEVATRYNPEIPILVGDRIKWRGFEFTVVQPIPDRIKRKMKIIAIAEFKTSDRSVNQNT